MAVDISRAIAELREIADGLRPQGIIFFWTEQQVANNALAKRLARIADELTAATGANEPGEIETPTPAAAE